MQFAVQHLKSFADPKSADISKQYCKVLQNNINDKKVTYDTKNEENKV